MENKSKRPGFVSILLESCGAVNDITTTLDVQSEVGTTLALVLGLSQREGASNQPATSPQS